MAERAQHRPPSVLAWRAVWVCLALCLALWPVARADAAPFAAVVMDARTGEILHGVNHTTRLHPASLTKMMTLYVAFEAIRNGEISLDTMVRISPRAAAEPPSRLGLRAGQRIALRHLIRAAALRSGNDAATAIAEAVGGSVEGFTRRMNRTAAAIGMTGSQFRNAHGLTQSGHYSTARDMTILGRQLYFDFPEYYGIFGRRSEDAGIARVNNTNSRFLDGYRGADGIKTGFTQAAGYNLTAMAERNGVRIVATVFGGRSIQHRHDQMVSLMDRGFREAPRRATVRRPGRPAYVGPSRGGAGTEVAEAATSAAPRESRASGRTIRLQTAPPRSIFPQRRPAPDAPPPAQPAPELLAALQSGIDATLATIAEPPAEATPPPAATAVALARSPLPRGRPQAAVAEVAPPEVETAAADIEAARAAGFSVIAPEELAALVAPGPAEPAAEVAEALAADTPAISDPPASDAGAALVLAALPPRARAAPAARPSQAAELAPVAVAEAETSPADPADETGPELAEAPNPPPGQTEGEVPQMVAAAEVIEGLVMIPGLPPIPVAMPEAEEEPALAEGPTILPALDTRPEPALVVTAEGQILWHDEDLLTVIDEVAPQIEGPGVLVLTVQDQPAVAAPMPEAPQIVVRASTSGGQLWGIDLGAHGSRFDAERTLLRIALAESTSLGGGVRRVAERGGRYRATILSLTQDQADRACARLGAQGQSCEVMAP